jgi:hypothetical protein
MRSPACHIIRAVYVRRLRAWSRCTCGVLKVYPQSKYVPFYPISHTRVQEVYEWGSWMCGKVFTVGVLIRRIGREGDGEEAGRVESGSIGHSLGRVGETNVNELVDVEIEDVGDWSGLGGCQYVRGPYQ